MINRGPNSCVSEITLALQDESRNVLVRSVFNHASVCVCMSVDIGSLIELQKPDTGARGIKECSIGEPTT
jgi:hypothetical protein